MVHGYRYILVDDYEKCKKLLTLLEREDIDQLGFDTESSGPQLLGYSKGKVKEVNMINMYSKATSLTGFSLAHKASKRSWYVPLGHRHGNAPESLLGAFMEVLQKKTLYIHNVPHELLALGMARRPAGWLDTIILSWCLGMKAPRGYGLKELTPVHLGWSMSKFKDVVGDRTFAELLPAEGTEYACEDAVASLELASKFAPKLKANDLEQVFDDEMSIVEVVHRMQLNGMDVDLENIDNLKVELETTASRLYREWYKLAPFTHPPPRVWRWLKGEGRVVLRKDEQTSEQIRPSSTAELQRLWYLGIFGDIKESPKSEKSGAFSTSADALEYQMDILPGGSLGYQLAKILLELKVISKNLSAFTTGYKLAAIHSHDNRIHPSFLQHGTTTGRMSCRGPNLQQVPTRSDIGKRIRQMFIAPPGHKMVVADYGQLEYRIGAHYCGKGYLWDIFKAGGDPHQMTMDKFGFDRDTAKTVNFKGFYSGSMWGNREQLGMDKKQVREFQRELDETFSEERKLFRKIESLAESRGWVKTFFGFKRWLPDAKLHCYAAGDRGHNKYECDTCSRKAQAFRQAGNMVIQGTGAGVTKRAMLWWHDNYEAPHTRLLGQVHDELIVRAVEPAALEAAHDLEFSMVNASLRSEIRVPMAVEAGIGDSWGEAK